MRDILTVVKGYKLDEIAAAKRACPQTRLEAEVRQMPPPRGFVAALERRIDQGGVAVIAEIKARSPSKGVIRPNFSPAAHAAAYAAGGAACLSVLTDQPSFGGSREDLQVARASTSLPVLRKDFMFDSYQVFEARAWGADAILVILAAVEDALATDLVDTAMALDLDVLVEVHDEAELERALRLQSPLIGINNRDLKNFHTDLATTERLVPAVPPGHVVVSESGVSSAADVSRLGLAGVRAFLVGESLMRAADIEAATRALLAVERTPAVAMGDV